MADASALPSVADVVLAVIAVISAIIAVYSQRDTKRQADYSKTVADATVNSVELQKRGLELHERELKERDRRFLVEKASGYHQKLRGFVWVPWIHSADQAVVVRGSTSGLTIAMLFEPLDYPYRTYYDHAMQHLQAYDLSGERTRLMERIDAHNLRVKEFFEKEGIVPPGLEPETSLLEQERGHLSTDQYVVWDEILKFAKRLQEVVSNLEDGQLKGECDFERSLRQQLGL